MNQKDPTTADTDIEKEIREQAQGASKDAVETWREIQKESGDHVDSSATLAPLLNATPKQWLGSNDDPDVLIAVPNLGIDQIKVSVQDVRAHVRVRAKVLDLLDLEVGADVSIDKVEVDIRNVRVQAMVKIRLDNVVAITGQIMQLIDNHPEILSELTGGIGRGLEGALAGETVAGKKVEKQLDK